jgi:hypothetical protein
LNIGKEPALSLASRAIVLNHPALQCSAYHIFYSLQILDVHIASDEGPLQPVNTTKNIDPDSILLCFIGISASGNFWNNS